MQNLRLLNNDIINLQKRNNALPFEWDEVTWESARLGGFSYYLWVGLINFEVPELQPSIFDISIPIPRFFGYGQPISVCFIDRVLSYKTKPLPFLRPLDEIHFEPYADYYPIFKTRSFKTFSQWYYLCLWSTHPNDRSLVDDFKNAYEFMSDPVASVEQSMLYWHYFQNKDVNNPYPYVWLGYLNENVGKTRLAYVYYKKALKLNPGYRLAIEKINALLSKLKAVQHGKSYSE